METKIVRPFGRLGSRYIVNATGYMYYRLALVVVGLGICVPPIFLSPFSNSRIVVHLSFLAGVSALVWLTVRNGKKIDDAKD